MEYLKDLMGQREEALKHFRGALKQDKGEIMQMDTSG